MFRALGLLVLEFGAGVLGFWARVLVKGFGWPQRQARLLFLSLARDWLTEAGGDCPEAVSFLGYVMCVVVFLPNQRIHLKDIGRGNLGVRRGSPLPTVAFFDQMSWQPAKPKSKAYTWQGLWKLVEEFAPKQVALFNEIRTSNNGRWERSQFRDVPGSSPYYVHCYTFGSQG